MTVSLIVSTYNRLDALAKVFGGLEMQSQKPLEVLIADDGSGPATRELINSWRKASPTPVKHVWHADEGFRKTGILNKALSEASGDYVVLLDGDCVPHPRFIEDHLSLAEKGFWVQGRRCFVKEQFVQAFDPRRTSIISWAFAQRVTGLAKAFRLPFPVVRKNTEQRGIIGCNMGFWHEDLVAVNGFDEEYSGWGIGEDSDVGTRLYNLGRPRKFVYGRAIVYHLDHPAAPRDHVDESMARLEETIRTRKIRCERGLNQYFASSKR